MAEQEKTGEQIDEKEQKVSLQDVKAIVQSTVQELFLSTISPLLERISTLEEEVDKRIKVVKGESKRLSPAYLCEKIQDRISYNSTFSRKRCGCAEEQLWDIIVDLEGDISELTNQIQFREDAETEKSDEPDLVTDTPETLETSSHAIDASPINKSISRTISNCRILDDDKTAWLFTHNDLNALERILEMFDFDESALCQIDLQNVHSENSLWENTIRCLIGEDNIDHIVNQSMSFDKLRDLTCAALRSRYALDTLLILHGVPNTKQVSQETECSRRLRWAAHIIVHLSHMWSTLESQLPFHGKFCVLLIGENLENEIEVDIGEEYVLIQTFSLEAKLKRFRSRRRLQKKELAIVSESHVAQSDQVMPMKSSDRHFDFTPRSSVTNALRKGIGNVLGKSILSPRRKSADKAEESDREEPTKFFGRDRVSKVAPDKTKSVSSG